MQKKTNLFNRNNLFLGFALVILLVLFFSNTSFLFQKAEAGKTDLVDMQFTFRKIAEKVMPQVVEINVVEVKVQQMPEGYSWPFNFIETEDEADDSYTPYEYEKEGLGSGIIVRKIDQKYYVLTNNHVIGDANRIKIKLHDMTEVEADIVGIDTRKDIALISFESEKQLSIANLGDSNNIAIGDIVLAVGSPLGYNSSMTAGIISALGRNGPDTNINDFIQTDAAINQGNSGGALVNLDGEVIGVNTWIATNTGESIGLAFSIPINNVKKTIDDFIKSGNVKYGWLGVSISDPDEYIRKDLGVPETGGALVNNVYTSGPAYKSGIQAGDFITHADGKEIIDYKHFIRIIGDIRENDKIKLKILRENKEIETTAIIEARKEDIEISEMNKAIWPGIIAYPLSNEVLAELGLNENFKGVIISVQYGTRADESGLKDFDILKSINGKEINNLIDFYNGINTKDKIYDIILFRDGQEQNLILNK